MIEKIKNRLYERFTWEATEDYVGLWQVAKNVREDLDLKAPQTIMEISLSIVERLLKEGGLLVGDAKWEYPFPKWDLTADEAIKRIRKEWLALGKAPSPGEICCFTSSKFLELIRKDRESEG